MDRSIVLSILGAAVLGFVGMLLLMPTRSKTKSRDCRG